MAYFYIDLLKRDLVINECEREDFAEDMEDEGVRDPLRLSDYDFKVFSSADEAVKFQREYMEASRALKRFTFNWHRGEPHMLYKRRYLIQTLMGLKNYTVRDYDRGWKPGTLFVLHDQTHFLPVRLKRITPTSDERFRYDFEVLDA